jgi:glycine reductase
LKRAAEKDGTDDLVVLLGTPTADSTELYAITMTEGDPSWAGALAGVALRLPVYHVTEDEVKNQVDPAIYDEEIGIAEMVLDVDGLRGAAKKIRDKVENSA